MNIENVGIELELSFLLVVMTLGMVIFGRFEADRPIWKGLLKSAIIILGTVGLYEAVGHWSLLLPSAALIAGGTVHTVWCRRNDIHPIYATPRRRYYELRGWQWPE